MDRDRRRSAIPGEELSDVELDRIAGGIASVPWEKPDTREVPLEAASFKFTPIRYRYTEHGSNASSTYQKGDSYDE